MGWVMSWSECCDCCLICGILSRDLLEGTRPCGSEYHRLLTVMPFQSGRWVVRKLMKRMVVALVSGLGYPECHLTRGILELCSHCGSPCFLEKDALPA